MEKIKTFRRRSTQGEEEILFLLLTNKAGCAKMRKESNGKKGMVDR